MTLIVTDGTAMAADSLLNDDGMKGLCDKLVRLEGAVLGSAGDAALTTRFERWRQRGGPRPKIAEDADFQAMEVTPNGIFIYDHHLTAFAVRLPFYAVGVDRIAAMCLLAKGATLVEAIFEVCRWSTNVAPPAVVMHLDGRTELFTEVPRGG